MKVRITYENAKYSPFINGYIKARSREALSPFESPPAQIHIVLSKTNSSFHRSRIVYEDKMGVFEVSSIPESTPSAAVEDAITKLQEQLMVRENILHDGYWLGESSQVG